MPFRLKGLVWRIDRGIVSFCRDIGFVFQVRKPSPMMLAGLA
jgi:hypothetical protein